MLPAPMGPGAYSSAGPRLHPTPLSLGLAYSCPPQWGLTTAPSRCFSLPIDSTQQELENFQAMSDRVLWTEVELKVNISKTGLLGFSVYFLTSIVVKKSVALDNNVIWPHFMGNWGDFSGSSGLVGWILRLLCLRLEEDEYLCCSTC